jgi:transcriptional regulator of acetoin/glycerol metabolism
LKKWGYPTVRISDEAMDLFMGYHWPGNVRELENVLRQTLLLSPFTLILPENLPAKFHPSRSEEIAPLSPLEKAERQQILQALESTTWNQSRAALRLGIDRKTLRNKIQRYSLVRDIPI